MAKARTRKLLANNAPAVQAAIWFYHDFVVRYAGRLILITGLGLSSATLQASALIAGKYVLEQKTSALPSFLQSTIDEQDLVSWGAIVLLAVLGASALLTFLETRAVANLWRRYQLHSMDALLLAIQRACQRNAITLESVGRQAVRRILRQVQRLGASSRIVSSAIAPALRFVAFSTYAVISNPLLTIALILAFLPSAGLALLFFARKASRCARAIIDLQEDETLELDQRLEAAADGKYVPLKNLQTDDQSAIDRRIVALTGRLLWVGYSRFFTTIITIFVLAIFLILVLNTEVFGGNGWASLFTYIVALYLSFQQLIQLASSISALGRFYPAITQQKAALEALDHAKNAEEFWKVLEKVGISRDVPDDAEEEVF